MTTRERMLELKSYEQMCRAALAATAYFETACLTDPMNIPAGEAFRVRDIRDCRQNLEKTYLVMIFARFEASLRDYWRIGCGKHTHPQVNVLLDRIAVRSYMQADALLHAHAVREYRNSIVHGGHALSVAIAEARNYLCTYLSHLPRQW